jgi:hypothetical protein
LLEAYMKAEPMLGVLEKHIVHNAR